MSSMVYLQFLLRLRRFPSRFLDFLLFKTNVKTSRTQFVKYCDSEKAMYLFMKKKGQFHPNTTEEIVSVVDL